MTDPTLLISAYFDEELSAEQFSEFSDWLGADVENARLFARRAMMEHHLCECRIGQRAIDLNESIVATAVLDEPSEITEPDDAFRRDLQSLAGPTQVAAQPPLNKRHFPWRWVAGILLPITIVAGAWALLHRGSAPATLVASESAQWTSVQPKTGELLPAGTLELKSGLIEVRMVSGASMIVEGPATFRVRSQNAVDLGAGHLTAVVPEAAHGFAVQTPSAMVVDLGTEFGVGVETDAATHLEVFLGKVQAGPLHASASDDAKRTVTVNQTADVTGSAAVVAAVPAGPSPFVRKQEFDARVAASKGSSYDRWLAYSYQLRRDPDIVAYYAFDNAAESPKRLLNRSYLGGNLDGILGLGSSAVGESGSAPGAKDLSVIDGAPIKDALGRTNTPSWTTGRWPQKGALAFDRFNGSRIRLAVSADDPLDFSTGGLTAKPFTITAWICPTHSGSIISKGPALAEQYAIDIDPSGHLRAWIRYPGSDPDHPVAVIANPVNLGGNKWLNLAMTYDPSARSVRLYIDGSLAGEAIAPSDTLVQTVEPIRMGARLRPINYDAAPKKYGTASKSQSAFLGDIDSSTFAGRIDELSIFRRAFSADQVKEMYEAGRPD